MMIKMGWRLLNLFVLIALAVFCQGAALGMVLHEAVMVQDMGMMSAEMPCCGDDVAALFDLEGVSAIIIVSVLTLLIAVVWLVLKKNWFDFDRRLIKLKGYYQRLRFEWGNYRFFYKWIKLFSSGLVQPRIW